MRETPTLTETLFLKADGIFEQEVVYTNGQKFTSVGNWKSEHRSVRIRNIYDTVSDDYQKDIYPPKLYPGWGMAAFLYGKNSLYGDQDGERPIYFFVRVKK